MPQLISPCADQMRGQLILPLLTALFAALPVHAQEVRDSADAQTLDTIIVTSQGRREELQKAAAPIAVFSEIQIQNAGIKDTADFVRLVPNMSYDTSFTIGNSFVSMRGIQQINNADAPVAIVVDGVPQTNQKEFKMDLFDIEQIEVLRGPQGALYGRNAVAGAIVINTKQPSNYAEGFAQFGLGSGGLRKFTGSASGPIAKDQLFYRLSMTGSDFDGDFYNAYHGLKANWFRNLDLRGQLKWQPNEHQQIEWRANSSKLRGGAIFDSIFDFNDTANANLWREPISDILGRSDRHIEASSLRYKWEGQTLTLTSITGYTHIFEDYYGDLDFCNPDIACPGNIPRLGQTDQSQALKLNQLSQELRLGSSQDATIQWSTGIYFLNTRRKLHTLAYRMEFDPLLLLVDSNESNRNRAWAVFGQVQFPLGNADRLEVSLRLDHDRRRQTNLNTGFQVNDGSWSAWQPKLTWSHDLDETQMLYATAGRGFRSGGFNGIGGVSFRPELLTNYEMGYKSSWLDNRLTFNTAVFYEYDKNYQFFYNNLAAGGAQVISNLNRVEITGLESDLNWRLHTGFEVFASLGLLHSKIKDTGPLSTALPITNGRRVPRSEPYKAVLGSQWNFVISDYRAMVRFDVSRNGSRTWEADNAYIMDPVTLVNARFTFFSNQQWEITAWASNLFNHRYYADFASAPFNTMGRDRGSLAAGRRYGIEMRYDF